ncbi:MAG: D-alanine--D-alanine ligase [Bdellovibrionaceae bacterium]|nr:D-alanine--D-alanine ligase [Bdellovibrionales bacterium]MCB9254937.1 D-alanine--D-alanine ligase [Pseudobdellovibrionaceae bacterium]
MKKTVLLLCGGRSDEHEISLISAYHVLQAIDRKRFSPIVVGIGKDGTWYLEEESSFYVDGLSADTIQLNTKRPKVSLLPYLDNGRGTLQAGEKHYAFDVVFPILHGPFGEDGTLQGLFETVGVPYVGANCGSSWNCMDKERTKLLCAQAGIPSARFVVLHAAQEFTSKAKAIEELGWPVFVKPARQGSSVGINKVSEEKFLEDAILEAFCFDNKVLVEAGVVGRELECGVLGLRSKPKASVVGEIVPSTKVGFYSYQEKYLASETELLLPAPLDEAQTREVQALALRVFSVMECDGMARVDFFAEASSGKLLLNEINTIPGFTPISMYPKLWKESGVDYPSLVTRLLELAYERKGESCE